MCHCLRCDIPHNTVSMDVIFRENIYNPSKVRKGFRLVLVQNVLLKFVSCTAKTKVRNGFRLVLAQNLL